jgi:hypothetical protein
MTAIAFASLTVAVTLVGIDGLPKAAPAIRPLRKTPTGFGVVYHGKVLPVTPTSANTGTAKLTDARFDPATCPVAKKTDLAAAIASQPKAEPVAAAYAKAPEPEPAKKPRTIAQMQATVAMQQKRAEKVMGSGDERQIASALKALATAEANLAEAQKPAKPAKKSRKGQPKADASRAHFAEERKADERMPTKAELMAQIEALSQLLAQAK